MTKTRDCLISLESCLSRKMLIYFLGLDRMHISSEAELMAALARYKQ